MIPTDNVTRSFPFTFELRKPLFCPVSSHNIAEIRIYVTDSLGRLVNFNGIDWFMTDIALFVSPSLTKSELNMINKLLKIK